MPGPAITSGWTRHEARQPASLVPQVWRERYGEELLALIQDTRPQGGHSGCVRGAFGLVDLGVTHY
jgi:hypothetical protein